MEKCFLLAMPISGSKIANQIAGILLLTKCGYRPEIILGSSGGCITATLMLACGISKVEDEESFDDFRGEIKSILNEISAANYSKTWCEIRPINTLIGIGKGSQFDRGTGAVFLDPEVIDLTKEPELWMGTFNKSRGNAEFFCTKAKEECKLHLPKGVYLDGNVDDVIQIATASSTIPGMVPWVKFRGQYYQDGGIEYASPMGHWIKHFDDTNISFHVVYVSPICFDTAEDPQDGCDRQDDDIRKIIRAKAHSILTGWHVPDRNNGILHVLSEAKRRGLTKVNRSSGFGEDALIEALENQKDSQVSFIEIAPRDGVLVNFLKMKKGDLTDAVRKSYAGGFTVRHWYF